MVKSILDFYRKFNSFIVLRKLKNYRHPEDSPALALKIVRQRSLGTSIGVRCRFMGRVDALNPQLIEIGDYCVIGAESMLLAHGPGFDGNSRTVIGDYTYIGYRVTVLTGISIGHHCIIGAGSVVTRDIPVGKVAAGNPARILRDATSEEKNNIHQVMDNDLFFGKAG